MALKSSTAIEAFRNEKFLESKDARSLRILAEYHEPASRFARYAVDDTIVFLGSARILSEETARERLAEARRRGGDVEKARIQLEMSRYYEAARTLARRLTEWSKELAGDKRRFVGAPVAAPASWRPPTAAPRKPGA